MPNKLDHLTIDEVSLVDSPANSERVNGRKVPRATVALFKRDLSASLWDSEDAVCKAVDGPDEPLAIAKANSGVLLSRVMKDLYPPLGNTSGAPKAQSYKEVLDSIKAIHEFKEFGDAFQEKMNALGQAVWSIIADETVKDKKKPVSDAIDAFVESAKTVVKSGKTYGGVTFPKGDFAYTPDDVLSHWKLRLTAAPGGKPDAGIVGAAAAALGKGFRGKKVQIPAEALAGVKAKVRAAWKAANEGKDISEMPAVLKGEKTMTLEQIEKKLADTDVVIKSLTDERDFSKSETEAVLKMSKKERKLYAGMDAEKRKAYMAADEGKRKEMMEACAKAKKEKAAEDSMDEACAKRFRAAGPRGEGRDAGRVRKEEEGRGEGSQVQGQGKAGRRGRR